MSPELLKDVDEFARESWARAAALLSQADAGNRRRNQRVRKQLLKATAALSVLRLVSRAATIRGETKLVVAPLISPATQKPSVERSVNEIKEACRAKLDMDRCNRTVENLIAKKIGTMWTWSDDYVGLVAEVERLREAYQCARDNR